MTARPESQLFVCLFQMIMVGVAGTAGTDWALMIALMGIGGVAMRTSLQLVIGTMIIAGGKG